MRLLIIGDAVGDAGVSLLERRLGELKKRYKPDLTVINAENSAYHNGTDRQSAERLFAAGADILTGGNHSFDKKDHSFFDEMPYLLRPYNFGDTRGNGFCLYDMRSYRVAVISIVGRVYMNEGVDDPFQMMETLLEELGKEASVIILDFHAEATSEKAAMGYFLDGRVSAVLGTHTHALTNDERILPGGTAYITDLGFTGCLNSVLGVKKEIVIGRFTAASKERFEQDGEPPFVLTGAVVDIDEKSGRAEKIMSVREYFER